MFKRLINLGVMAGLPRPYARKVRTVNLASMLSIGLFTFFSGFLFVRGYLLLGCIYAAFGVLYTLPLWLNHRAEYLWSRVAMLLVTSVALISVEFLIRSTSRFVFIVCLLLLGVFLAENKRQSMITALGVALLFLIIQFIPTWFDVSGVRLESTVSYWVNMFYGGLGIYFIIDTFKADSLIYEEELSQANIDLEIKRVEAEVQKVALEKTAEALEAKNRELSSFNLQMQDSIRYAKRIQSAMLPTKDQLRLYLPELLLFFKPKDILSGDFYWFFEADGLIFLAVADCTGHGVPGAIMTVLGNNLLHRAVGRDGLRSPAAILTELDRRVREMLSQRTEAGITINDGMDMALICLDRTRGQVTFAGAGRPLIAFHGTASEITVYPGSRLYIGGAEKDQRQFDELTFAVREGDMLYLFTDGVTDQLGPQGKFLTKRFKDLLKHIHRRPLPEQHRMINEAFLRWKLTEPQTDDILVAGVRV